MNVPEYLRTRADLIDKLFGHSPEVTRAKTDITRLREIAKRYAAMEMCLQTVADRVDTLGEWGCWAKDGQYTTVDDLVARALAAARAPIEEKTGPVGRRVVEAE